MEVTLRMRRDGVEYTCDRCGKVEFVSWHPLQLKYDDKEPKEWFSLDRDHTRHLCPTCADKYFDILSHFLNDKEATPI